MIAKKQYLSALIALVIAGCSGGASTNPIVSSDAPAVDFGQPSVAASGVATAGVTVTAYNTPPVFGDYRIQSITFDGTGQLWLQNSQTNLLRYGHHIYYLPSSFPKSDEATGLMTGADGAVYFIVTNTEPVMLERVVPDGSRSIAPITGLNLTQNQLSEPFIARAIASGDGFIYIAYLTGNSPNQVLRIARIARNGFVEYDRAVSASKQLSIGTIDWFMPGTHGDVWVCTDAGPAGNYHNGQWLDIATSTASVLRSFPSAYDNPSTQFGDTNSTSGAVIAPDGNLYSTAAILKYPEIDKLDLSSGTWTRFALPNASQVPSHLIVGNDGDLWFITTTFPNANDNRVGRFSLGGTFSEYSTNPWNNLIMLAAPPKTSTILPSNTIWTSNTQDIVRLQY